MDVWINGRGLHVYPANRFVGQRPFAKLPEEFIE